MHAINKPKSLWKSIQRAPPGSETSIGRKDLIKVKKRSKLRGRRIERNGASANEEMDELVTCLMALKKIKIVKIQI